MSDYDAIKKILNRVYPEGCAPCPFYEMVDEKTNHILLIFPCGDDWYDGAWVFDENGILLEIN